jgi:threonine synthase
LLIGLARGFQALTAAGCLTASPVMIGVQAEAIAPLAGRVDAGSAAVTAAEGVRVRSPLRREEALDSVRRSGGRFIVARETELFPGRDELARLGFYVEPTSALVWPALRETLSDLQDPVIAVLTGSGYKVFG